MNDSSPADFEYAVFRDSVMTTKKELLTKISEIKKSEMLPQRLSDGQKPALIRILDDLYTQVEDSELFDAPEGYWYYKIEITFFGAKVILASGGGYVDDDHADPDDYRFIINENGDEYTMFSSEARLLTAGEYAALCSVSANTIRQWIRRGKIRDAVKLGSEWFVPELFMNSGDERGFTPARYSWSQPFPLRLQNFEQLAGYTGKYNNLSIKKGGSNDERILEFSFRRNEYEKNFPKGKEGSSKIIKCSREDAEKIETLFIANPFVKHENALCVLYE